MRCPKCHYLSFDPEPRCKNCGYDLEVADADLAFRTNEPADDALPDLTLHERPSTSDAPVEMATARAGSALESAPEPQWEPEPEPEWDPVTEAAAVPSSRLALVETEAAARPTRATMRTTRAGAAVADPPQRPAAPVARLIEPPARATEPSGFVAERPAPLADWPEPVAEPVRSVTEPTLRVAEPPATRTPFRAPNTTAELPLFVKGIVESESLPDEGDRHRPMPSLTLPAARPPLSVRRAAPEPVRTRQKPADRRLGPLEQDLLEDLNRVEREEMAQTSADRRLMAGHVDASDATDPVDPMHRVAAAAIDIGVLGGIATFVFWATLRLCNVNLSDLSLGALLPLLFFLVMMDAGYLLMFTAAGGQTVGKMLLGIRVIGSDDDGGSLSIRQAAWRALLTMVALGIGWLPVLIGRGTLHDRLAHTRVVRA